LLALKEFNWTFNYLWCLILISEEVQIYKFLIRWVHAIPRSRHSWWKCRRRITRFIRSYLVILFRCELQWYRFFIFASLWNRRWSQRNRRWCYLRRARIEYDVYLYAFTLIDAQMHRNLLTLLFRKNRKLNAPNSTS